MAANHVRLNIVNVRPERVLRDRNNPLEELAEEEVRQRFRFRPESIYEISRILFRTLQRATHRSSSLPVLLQILVALRFFASGSFQLVISDTLTVSQATVSRCVRAVSLALVNIADRFIRFPSQGEEVDVKRRFYALAGFPNVIGCIDGCLIKIKKPSQNVQEFICRKGYPALNCQFTCLPDHRFSSIVAKWPGSCHDSRIFNESELCGYMANGDHGVLLGDSGYANRRYLFTPFINPQNGPQQRYNTAHCQTRVKVEQAFGILKNRFGCLLIPLRMVPDRAVSVIIAVTVLHNIAIMCRDNFQPLDDDNDNDDDDDDDNDIPNLVNDAQHGLAARNHYVTTYFS